MIKFKYWNEQLQIGMVNWRNVYQFPQREQMLVELHQNKLCYRLKGMSKRISYEKLKKGLVKRSFQIKEAALPF
jgi:hypothetical protein